MLTLLRKLIAVLRGGAGTREILLGLMVGFLIGMVPGLNLTLVLCIFLIFLLNANVGVISLGFLAGKITCMALAPVTFELGYMMIHSFGLEGVIRAASDTPVVALLDLDRYCLIGGLPLGLIGGLILGGIVASIITKVRKKIVASRKDNKALDELLKKWYVKLIVRVFAGKKPRNADMAEALDKESPIIRKSGMIVALGAVVVVLLVEFLALNLGARAGLELALGRMNGAEVNIESADVSLFSGKADLRGIQVTDRDNVKQNIFASRHLAANFSVADLLKKRFVVELISVDKLKMDEARKSPGERYGEPRDTDDEGDTGEETKGDDETQMLTTLIEDWETYERYATKGKDYLDGVLKARKAKKELMLAGDPKKRLKYLKELAKRYGYFSLSAKTWLADKPTWELQELRAGGITLGAMLPTQTLRLRNVTSAPELQAQPISLALVGENDHETLATDILFKPDMSNSYEVRVDINSVPLDKVKLGNDIPVVVKSGNGVAQGKGTLADGALSVPFTLALTDLNLDVRGDDTILGMKPATAREVFAAVKTLDLSGTVVGSLDSVRVSIDYDKLKDSLSAALVNAGKNALARKVNEELDKAKKKASAEADKAISKEVKKLKDTYGEEIADKIGKENYKKLEGVVDNLDSKEIADTAEKVLGGLLGDKKSDKDNGETDKSSDSGKALSDAAAKALGGLLDGKDKTDGDKKDKKKKSVLDLF